MEKLDRLGWVVEHSYRVGEVTFGIRTTSEAFGDWLEYALGAYRTDEDEDPFYSVVVADDSDRGARSRRGFNILYAGATAMMRTMHLPTLGRTMLAQIEALLVAERDDAVFLDAMALDVRGHLMLAPASLAPVLTRFGRRLAADGVRMHAGTVIALDAQSGRAVGWRSALEVPADALDRLEAIGADHSIEDHFVLDESVPVAAVFVPDGQPDEPLATTARSLAVHRLASRTTNLKRISAGGLGAIADMTRGADCYAIGRGTARDLLQGFLTAADIAQQHANQIQVEEERTCV